MKLIIFWFRFLFGSAIAWILLLFLSLHFTASNAIAKIGDSVSIFSWWDYVPPEVIKKINNKAIKISLIEYRSNEVALSKLLSGKSGYDIAIVSNWVVRVLEKADKIESQAHSNLMSKRNYLQFTTRFADSCIPYLWSTTTFAADSSQLKIGPRNIGSLLALRKKSYVTGIVDDPIEFAARVVADNREKCSEAEVTENVLDRLNNCSSARLLSLPDKTDRGFFRNTLEPILGKKSAVYGWHGEIGTQINSLPTFEFYLPESKPVVGLDYVCILKGRSSKAVIDVVDLLTDEESTNINIAKTQYFSPYVNDTGQYSPKVKKLKEDLLNRMKTESPIILTPPSSEAHAKINKWWQKVRYGR